VWIVVYLRSGPDDINVLRRNAAFCSQEAQYDLTLLDDLNVDHKQQNINKLLTTSLLTLTDM